MQIVEFAAGTLRFLEKVPAAAPPAGFVWIYLERESLESEIGQLQQAAQSLGGSVMLDLHVKDLGNRAHPSQYDYTSVYDLVIFRRLATEAEARAEAQEPAVAADSPLAAFGNIQTRAVGFVVFDRLLITVHPAGCVAAKTFIQRFLADALQNEGLSAAARSRLPTGSSDLMLRMLNLMVDSYLDLRKDLSTGLDEWQHQLLGPRSRGGDWRALMSARAALHTLEDLCDGQNDAMQEWLDTQREQPAPWMAQAERDSLLARARDVIEHIQRVLRHVQAHGAGRRDRRAAALLGAGPPHQRDHAGAHGAHGGVSPPEFHHRLFRDELRVPPVDPFRAGDVGDARRDGGGRAGRAARVLAQALPRAQRQIMARPRNLA